MPTPAADTAALMPRHGTVGIRPAQEWEDALAAGNGTVGQIEEAALRRSIREQQEPWPEEKPAPVRPQKGRNP